MNNQGQGQNTTLQKGPQPEWARPKMSTPNMTAQGDPRMSTPTPTPGSMSAVPNRQTLAGPKQQNQNVPPGAPGSTQYQQMNQNLQTMPMQFATDMLGGNGVSQAGQNAISQLPGIGTGPGAAQQYLSGTAAGDNLNGSPYLSDIVNRSNQNIADQTNQLFAAGGRYGSGVHQGTLADSIASNTSNLLNSNYQQERDRQMQAAGAISGEQMGRLGLQSNNLMNAAQIGQQGINNQLSTISQLPTIQNNKIFDAQQQMGVGQQLDNRSQQQLNDLINRWTQGDMQGWSRLGGLLSAAGQAAGPWGTRTGSGTTTNNPSPLGMIGGGLSLMGGK